MIARRTADEMSIGRIYFLVKRSNTTICVTALFLFNASLGPTLMGPTYYEN